ncbi:MAG: hypothetical protein ABUS57_00105 [Pseudomonadota bacterium]
MRGTILGVHDGRGVLLSPGDKRLEFPLTEWRSPGAPAPGQVVDYVEVEGEARGVFIVPGSAVAGTAQSPSLVMSAVAAGCLALGFIIPLVPTVIAFVLGVIGANRALQDKDETALLLSRLAWIGALVMLGVLAIAVLGLALFFGGLAGFAWWHHWD